MSQVTGNLLLISSNGRIEFTEVSSTLIETNTSNGPIVMDLATAPDHVVADTSNGRIEIVLPTDAPVYAIEAKTRNGTTDLSTIATDPESPYTINAETANGNVSIRQSP